MKFKTIFRCQKCGFESLQWYGKCPDCGQWNSLLEEVIETSKKPTKSQKITQFSSELKKINEVDEKQFLRYKTNIDEFDRIVGGGVVKGSLILIGGPPGIGKSTLMLQVSEKLNQSGNVLYVSGEESLSQIKDRAKRLDIKGENIFLLSETDISRVIENFYKINPDFVIIDSIQTMYKPDFVSASGSVSQIRECTSELLNLAKTNGSTIFLLGHVTKEGEIAGPRVLEHIVDTVLYFETEQQTVYRILRSYKNRFGSTNEIGVFEMTSKGLKEVKNPSSLFLDTETQSSPGCAVTATIEGSRPFLVQVQALVCPTYFGVPRRSVVGLDYNRVMILTAVIQKFCGLHLENMDLFVNVVGGVKIRETAIDLATCLAIVSALKNYKTEKKFLCIGEVGLLGEVRPVIRIQERINESKKMGFDKIIIPWTSLKDLENKTSVIGIKRLNEILSLF